MLHGSHVYVIVLYVCGMKIMFTVELELECVCCMRGTSKL